MRRRICSSPTFTPQHVHPRSLVAILALAPAAICAAQSPVTRRNADWPVYGGSDDHTHYTTLGQISPANVRRLKVAWTFDTHDAFAGSAKPYLLGPERSSLCLIRPIS